MRKYFLKGKKKTKRKLTHEFALLFTGLESTMSEFRGGIDEDEGDFFSSITRDLGEKGLSEGQNTLLDSNSSSLVVKEKE